MHEGVKEFWEDFKILFYITYLFLQFALVATITVILLIGTITLCVILPIEFIGSWTTIITLPLYLTTCYALLNNSHLKKWVCESEISKYLADRLIVWRALIHEQ